VTDRPGVRRLGIGTAAIATTLALAACGGGDTASDPPLTPRQPASQAAAATFSVMATTPGVTPFISFVVIAGAAVQELAGVEFTIAPKPGSVSKAVHVRYSLTALSRQHYVFIGEGSGLPGEGFIGGEGIVRLPVFGLYAGFQNQVLVQLDFQDGSTKTLPVVIPTAAYTDPNGIYDHPTVLVPRAAGSALGFDFFVMKSNLGSPVIVDTDAEIRWVGAGVSSAFTSVLNGDTFLIGDQKSPTLHHLRLDGSLTEDVYMPEPPYVDFNHNIDYGKRGFLANFDTVYSLPGVMNLESTLVELDAEANIYNTWNLAEILSNYMRSQGDDPSAFVRPGSDWFHMNAATYDPSDDTVIVSSRENFLIKVDYTTGNIIWILGDPTKYWYTFPSLQAKALMLQPGGLYPIGQHAVSMTSDGLVMVFNDGYPSTNQPTGEPAGEARTYSAVSAYSVDAAARTAQEVWRFDYGQSIYSFVCSSAYEGPGGSVLVDYATAGHDTQARLVGLDVGHNVVFDFEYSNVGCNTSWNATPIALDDFAIN
jgi:arylsulfate sulfotransferase